MRISTAERHRLEEDAAYLVAMAAMNYLRKEEIEELLRDMQRGIMLRANELPKKSEVTE